MGIAKTLIESVKEGLTFAISSFDLLVNDASTILSGGISDSLWNSVVGLSNGLKPFCNIIIVICMLIEIAKISSQVDIIKWEHGLKIALKMVIAKVTIDLAPTFLRACYNQAGIFITYFASAGGSVSLSTMVNPQIGNLCDSIDGLGAAIGLLVTTSLLQLGIKLCGLMIKVIAYGRVFEILVYVAVSPIPCAFAPIGNGNDVLSSRITINFAKSFIAVCLQGLIMFLCIRLFGLIIGSSFTDAVNASLASGASAGQVVQDLCYDVILFAIVLVMAVAKAGSWAKSIMDAH